MPGILLVDDEDIVRGLLKLLLTSSGYEVWEASDGNRVNELYERHRPDLVVLDIVMPDKEGLEIIKELRLIDPNARIIAMSGGGTGKAESYLLLAMKLGAKYTLSKPFRNEDFLRTVRMALAPEP